MTSDRPLPPYEDRKASADPLDEGGTEKQGAEVGGARQHRTSDAGTADDGGSTASPAEEQPAGAVDGAGEEDPGTGPAHTPGVPRGEDQRG